MSANALTHPNPCATPWLASLQILTLGQTAAESCATNVMQYPHGTEPGTGSDQSPSSILPAGSPHREEFATLTQMAAGAFTTADRPSGPASSSAPGKGTNRLRSEMPQPTPWFLNPASHIAPPNVPMGRVSPAATGTGSLPYGEQPLAASNPSYDSRAPALQPARADASGAQPEARHAAPALEEIRSPNTTLGPAAHAPYVPSVAQNCEAADARRPYRDASKKKREPHEEEGVDTGEEADASGQTRKTAKDGEIGHAPQARDRDREAPFPTPRSAEELRDLLPPDLRAGVLDELRRRRQVLVVILSDSNRRYGTFLARAWVLGNEVPGQTLRFQSFSAFWWPGKSFQGGSTWLRWRARQDSDEIGCSCFIGTDCSNRMAASFLHLRLGPRRSPRSPGDNDLQHAQLHIAEGRRFLQSLEGQWSISVIVGSAATIDTPEVSHA